LTPAERKSRKRAASTEVGLASSVTSTSAASGHAPAIASSTAATVAACIKDGVPPPKKMLATSRPGASAAQCAISRA